MQSGRKPKPTAVKALEGNPGKRSLNTGEPKPEKKAPRCPAWLEGEAKKEWKRMAGQMEKLGILTEIDMAAFAGYCQAYARSTWRHSRDTARRMPDRHGGIRGILPGVCQMERGGGIHHPARHHRKDALRLLAAGPAGIHRADLFENHEPFLRAVRPYPFLPEPHHGGGRRG